MPRIKKAPTVFEKKIGAAKINQKKKLNISQ